VHRQLGDLGIEVAILKGVATEARWYDRIGQRICTDVDVLLAPHALGSVADVIATLDPTCTGLDTVTELVRRRLLQHVDLRVGDTQVDLHFDPLKLGLPTRQLHHVWATTELLATPHGSIRVLSPEIELVLLLLHLNKDRFAFLGTFLDVKWLLEGTAVDWDAVERFVAGEGLAILVWSSLATVAEVLGIPVPIARPSGVRAWTWRRIWGGGTALGGHEGRRSAPKVQRLLAFHAEGRTADILRETSRQVIPPRPLLEVAGRLEPGASYFRYVAIDRFRRQSAGNRAARGADDEGTGTRGAPAR
jgi:hypothetical protein